MKKIAALLLARTMALSLAACGQKKTQLKILDTEFTVEDYAIAMKKGSTELMDLVNTALKELMDDGSVQAVVDKYIKA